MWTEKQGHGRQRCAVCMPHARTCTYAHYTHQHFSINRTSVGLSHACPTMRSPFLNTHAHTVTSDPSQLPSRGPCSKYELDIPEGQFKAEIEFIFEGEPFKVSDGHSCCRIGTTAVC